MMLAHDDKITVMQTLLNQPNYKKFKLHCRQITVIHLAHKTT